MNSQSQVALEADLKIFPEKRAIYNVDLHDRFIVWKDLSGDSLSQIARKLARSTTAVSQYINFKYGGDISSLEHDIKNLMRKEQDLRFAIKPDIFLELSSSRQIWEVLQFCDEQKKMGAVVAPSGSSKTMTAGAYTRKNIGTKFITADITKRSLGAILTMIAYGQSCTPYGAKNSELLESIVESLKWSKNLLIIDEAHLMSWEAFEAIRTIYDKTRAGVCYLGMPRLYSQMKGNKAYLWDQILSRLAIKQSITAIEKNDIRLIADSIYPRLPKNCINFLYEKSLGPGRLRVVVELLNRSVDISKSEQIPVNLELLKEVAKFIVF